MRDLSVVAASVVGAVLVLVAASCDDKPKPVPDASPIEAAATTPSTASTAPRPTAPTVIADAARPPPCRIVSWENMTPNTGDPTSLLTLADKAAISIRMSESTRELRFEGPGRVKACGGEVSFVIEGTVAALPGGGESPGSEQWVAAPCAAMRWASGHHKLIATKDTCRVQSSVVPASVFLPADVKAKDAEVDGGSPPGPLPAPGDDAFIRLEGRRALDITGVWTTPKAVAASLTACETAAGDLAKLTAAMGTLGTDGGGERAAQAISLRRRARATCAVAAARVHATGQKAEDQARIDRSTRGIFTF